MWVRALHLLSLAAAIIHAQYYDEDRYFRTCSTKCQCDGNHGSSNDRIVGGQDASRNEFPFLVLLMDPTTMCGGTIITAKHVMTAAHCADAMDYSATNVQIGLHTMDSPYLALSLAGLVKHPNYRVPDITNYGNDIAIGTTWETIEFGPRVQPACLPTTGGVTYRSGDKLHVAGWGLDRDGGMLQKILQKVEIYAINNKKCDSNYSPQKIKIIDDMICAGSAEGGKDACQGDSGGPLMRTNSFTKKRVVVGVVSFGIGCGIPEFPGVYTKVANFLPWIQEMIGSACLCSQT